MILLNTYNHKVDRSSGMSPSNIFRTLLAYKTNLLFKNTQLYNFCNIVKRYAGLWTCFKGKYEIFGVVFFT